MNREAAALGVPVYTTFGGRLGGVDEELIRPAGWIPITTPRALVVSKQRSAGDSGPTATRRRCSTSCFPRSS